MKAREIAVLRHQLLELVVVADHPVDVAAEMEVGVEDLGARGQQLLHLLVVAARRAPARVPSASATPES